MKTNIFLALIAISTLSACTNNNTANTTTTAKTTNNGFIGRWRNIGGGIDTNNNGKLDDSEWVAVDKETQAEMDKNNVNVDLNFLPDGIGFIGKEKGKDNTFKWLGDEQNGTLTISNADELNGTLSLNKNGFLIGHEKGEAESFGKKNTAVVFGAYQKQ